jgi:hypothetical protein
MKMNKPPQQMKFEFVQTTPPLYIINWRDKKTGDEGCCWDLPLFKGDAERLLKYYACDKNREYWISEQ